MKKCAKTFLIVVTFKVREAPTEIGGWPTRGKHGVYSDCRSGRVVEGS